MMFKTRRIGILTVLAFATLWMIAGCGFTPVYQSSGSATAHSVQKQLSQIQISNIPDRDGQYLRNALIDRFYKDGRPDSYAYIMAVQPVRERLIDLDITKTDDSTRGQLKLETSFVLRHKRSGEVLMSRKIQSITSYNILGSEFATRVTEQSARDNALNDLARQIETHLALWLKSD